MGHGRSRLSTPSSRNCSNPHPSKPHARAHLQTADHPPTRTLFLQLWDPPASLCASLGCFPDGLPAWLLPMALPPRRGLAQSPGPSVGHARPPPLSWPFSPAVCQWLSDPLCRPGPLAPRGHLPCGPFYPPTPLRAHTQHPRPSTPLLGPETKPLSSPCQVISSLFFFFFS